MNDLIDHEINECVKTLKAIDTNVVVKIADALTEVVRNGNKIIFMGNGGSSADAQHLAAEFTGKYLFDRPPMSAIALAEIAPMSAIGNDYSFDLVFKRQVLAHARKGDAVVGISTSGNSKNVIEAIKAAKEIGTLVITFTGPKGVMKDMADIPLMIPSEATPHIQEGYFVAGHTICGLVERNLFGKKAVFIDRDDTIVKDVPYCDHPDKLKIFDGVPEAIKELNDSGYLVIMITNQSGISRGKFTLDVLESVNKRLIDDIAKKGGRIDDVFFCPHHPDDKCECRKPETGMGVQAVTKYNINTKVSYMIGNSDADVEFGKRIGCTSFKVTDKLSFKDAVKRIITS